MNESDVMQPHRPTGWKPLPIIFKILWVLMILSAFDALIGIFTVGEKGTVMLGEHLFGLWAVNTHFILNIFLPVVLIVVMIRRARWAWILGVALALMSAVNDFMSVNMAGEMTDRMLSELPEDVLDMIPDAYAMFHLSFVMSIVLSGLIELFFGVMFVVKRKYFSGR